MLGGIDGKRRRGQQRMRWLDRVGDSMDMNLSKLQEIVKDRGAWCVLQSRGSQRAGHNLAAEQQQQTQYICMTPLYKILEKTNSSVVTESRSVVTLDCRYGKG